MNVIDLIFVILAAVMIFVGFKKGLIVSLLEMSRVLIGAPLSYFVSNHFSQPVYDNFVRSIAMDKINKEINEYANIDELTASFKQSISELPEFITSSLDLSKVSFTTNAKAAEFIEQNIVEPIAVMIIQVVLFLLVLALFSLVVIILTAVFKGLNRKDKMPLKTTNRLAGGALGVIRAAVIILVLSTVGYYAIELLSGQNNEFIEMLRSSRIIEFVSKINPFI